MTDVLLRHFADGGDIEYVNGQATTSNGLETAVYLSLFGGNERDSGQQAGDSLQWWGNLSESRPERRYRSRYQNLLRSTPLLPMNLRAFEDAAEDDLAWMFETGLATFVGAFASIPALNRLALEVQIEVDGRAFAFEFTRPGFDVPKNESTTDFSGDPSSLDFSEPLDSFWLGL